MNYLKYSESHHHQISKLYCMIPAVIVCKSELNTRYNATNLSSGVYTLKIITADSIQYLKFINNKNNQIPR